MKKLLLLIIAALSGNVATHAQLPFNTMDSLDINNITPTVLVHGDMWHDPVNYNARCSFPKDTPTTIGLNGALWMSGYDAGAQLHVSGQTYRQNGNDYWPGPLDDHDTLTYATSYHWAKIWKVNKTDIQHFLSLSTHTESNTPDAILSWPGKGNADARGNANYPLTITNDMAPFADLNGNSIYEPLLGEYPAIKGDQALWWVFSDNGPGRVTTTKHHCGIEVHAMCYGYKRGTLIDNVVYYEYNMINKSANNYNNFRAGLFTEIDLGYPFDDFIGFDSVHRMGIQYNGTNNDGGSAGHPVNSYGHLPPITGISLVSLPGDAGNSYVPAGSFTYYNNDFSIIGNPSTDTAYYNYMHSRLANGQHFTNDFIKSGMQTKGYGSGPDCNYVYYGDPADANTWSECNSNNSPNDRRFVLSSNDFSLPPGGHASITIAQVAVDTAGGCPQVTFDKIRIAADTAWGLYHSLPDAIHDAQTSTLKVYPNPAHDRLIIDNIGNQQKEVAVAVYNMIGQRMQVPVQSNNTQYTADISKLPAGLYMLHYSNDGVQQVVKFVKD